MPTQGLSLVGFMNQAQAINHLKNVCVPAAADDPALIAEWQAAQTRLGNVPIPNAGHPDIQPIPAAQQPFFAQLAAEPWIAQWLGTTPGVEFKLIEVDPLLAYQHAVDTDRSAHHCAALGGVTTLDALLPVCMPTSLQGSPITYWWTPAKNPHSVLIKSRGLNLRIMDRGMLGRPRASHAGIFFGTGVPLLQVVRFNGRCYLHNGFHRAVGLRGMGVTHVPCAIRDVGTAAEAGIATDGGTFDLATLESANPPTLGHFTQGLAYPVRVRSVSRILHVSWSEYAVPDE